MHRPMLAPNIRFSDLIADIASEHAIGCTKLVVVPPPFPSLNELSHFRQIVPSETRMVHLGCDYYESTPSYLRKGGHRKSAGAFNLPYDIPSEEQNSPVIRKLAPVAMSDVIRNFDALEQYSEECSIKRDRLKREYLGL